MNSRGLSKQAVEKGSCQRATQRRGSHRSTLHLSQARGENHPLPDSTGALVFLRLKRGDLICKSRQPPGSGGEEGQGKLVSKKKPSIRKLKHPLRAFACCAAPGPRFTIRVHWSITFKRLCWGWQKNLLTPRWQLTREEIPSQQKLFLKILHLFLVVILGKEVLLNA